MKNVCKFPLTSGLSELTVNCFVYETNKETMKKKTILQNNRVILIEQGEGTFLFNNSSFPFTTGTLIFGFEGETFCLENATDVQYLYIDFSGTRANALLQRFGIFPSNRKAQNFSRLIPFCKESLFNSPQETIDVSAESVLLYVFSRLSSTNLAQNDVLQKIILFIEEHFHEPDLSIGQISSEIGYSDKYISHFFKSKMNVSYSEYLRSIRFKYAISLFENGISSIKNVAYLSGFSDPLYFSNAFKKAIGCSPKEFILNLNNGK